MVLAGSSLSMNRFSSTISRSPTPGVRNCWNWAAMSFGKAFQLAYGASMASMNASPRTLFSWRMAT